MNSQGPDKENAGARKKKTKKPKIKQKGEKNNEKETQLAKKNKVGVKGINYMRMKEGGERRKRRWWRRQRKEGK